MKTQKYTHLALAIEALLELTRSMRVATAECAAWPIRSRWAAQRQNQNLTADFTDS